MMKAKPLTAVGLVTVMGLSTTVVPLAFAQTASAPYQTATINAGATVIHSVPRFTKNGITYMPIWYVEKALTAVGVHAVWNGVSHVWSLSAPHSASTSARTLVGKGVTTISVNGSIIETGVPVTVRRDPQSHVLTTFMPIWYVEQALTGASVSGVWNGNTDVWALNSASSPTSANAKNDYYQTDSK
ncbi:MAG: hypothetical protein ACYCYO_22095 [Bacilli bacterium]